MAALRSLLADNSEFVRKMYNDMDTAVLEFIAMRDTIKKSLDLIKTDLNNGRWDKFPDTITVSSMNTFIHGQSNSLDVFVQYGK